MEFRIAGPRDEDCLTELFAHIDDTYFRPHPFDGAEARRIAAHTGRDVYALLLQDRRAVAYGLLRGWDDGFETPSLGIAVRSDDQSQGLGRVMMAHLHHQARARGASAVRLRVHPANVRARQLYESLGYRYAGAERDELVMILDLGPERSTSPRATRRADRAGGGHRLHLVGIDDPAWEEWLGDVSRDVYHMASYHGYARDSGEGEPYLVVVGDRGRGMAWPYLLRPVAAVAELAGSTATDVTSVYGYPGPLAWGCEPGDAFLDQAWRSIVGLWREQGAVSAFTRFHPLLGNAALADGFQSPADPSGGSVGVVPVGPTVSVDLTAGLDGIREGYGRDLRREIAVAQRAGLATEHDEAWRELATFTRLYRETMIRNRASEYYFFGEDDFRRLRAALGDRLHLLVTRAAGAVSAAGLFTEYRGIVEWYLVGTSDAYRKVSPSKVLIDDAIVWARQRGDTVLHFGGGRGGREDSLLWFKSRFSRRRHDFHIGRWILDPAAYSELLTARRADVAGQGQLDPGFFPGYRAPLRRDLVPQLAPLRPGSMWRAAGIFA